MVKLLQNDVLTMTLTSFTDREIQLNTWPRKLIAITLVLLICSAVIYRTW
jgi:hypothetical protein